MYVFDGLHLLVLHMYNHKVFWLTWNFYTMSFISWTVTSKCESPFWELFQPPLLIGIFSVHTTSGTLSLTSLVFQSVIGEECISVLLFLGDVTVPRHVPKSTHWVNPLPRAWNTGLSHFQEHLIWTHFIPNTGFYRKIPLPRYTVTFHSQNSLTFPYKRTLHSFHELLFSSTSRSDSSIPLEERLLNFLSRAHLHSIPGVSLTYPEKAPLTFNFQKRVLHSLPRATLALYFKERLLHSLLTAIITLHFQE